MITRFVVSTSGPLFRTAPAELGKRMVERGVVLAAQDYTEAVLDWIAEGQSFTPRTGGTEQGIGWRPVSHGVAEIYANGPRSADLEYGTKAHEIRPRAGRKALRIPIPEGGFILRRRVWHPGTQAKPFMFADLENRRGIVMDAMLRGVAQVVGA